MTLGVSFSRFFTFCTSVRSIVTRVSTLGGRARRRFVHAIVTEETIKDEHQRSLDAARVIHTLNADQTALALPCHAELAYLRLNVTVNCFLPRARAERVSTEEDRLFICSHAHDSCCKCACSVAQRRSTLFRMSAPTTAVRLTTLENSASKSNSQIHGAVAIQHGKVENTDVALL